MEKLVLVTGCMLMMACTGESEQSSGSLASEATAAISQMERTDAEAVEGCNEAIPECTEEDAETEACMVLKGHCKTLDGDLAEVRGPAVGCWHKVADCEETGEETCDAEAETCDRFDDDLHANRKPIIGCAEIAEMCLAEAAEVDDDVATCEALIAKCEKVVEWATKAEHARFDGDKEGDDECRRHAEEEVPGDWSPRHPNGGMDGDHSGHRGDGEGYDGPSGEHCDADAGVAQDAPPTGRPDDGEITGGPRDGERGG